ncbi:hypothetical protein TW95_gp0521 [Pandoravirus inopinatum]|uniref:Uncharacterized protein n=1 Tax=Pandoravirus inopinatum TaxID=1605721 RepID=A0A0B5J695_9VIRU|nr:hypothetical protein TW95_gp0521 [Pandoravirus inopinatum]AJF97255.1 hypothetical protein [Pandoravirus inopinatum]
MLQRNQVGRSGRTPIQLDRLCDLDLRLPPFVRTVCNLRHNCLALFGMVDPHRGCNCLPTQRPFAGTTHVPSAKAVGAHDNNNKTSTRPRPGQAMSVPCHTCKWTLTQRPMPTDRQGGDPGADKKMPTTQDRMAIAPR